MTVAEMANWIGCLGAVKIGDFDIHVKILDLRERFGTMDCLITPLCGEGQKWVEFNRFRLLP
jgi:hypothetical protein